MNTPMQTYPPLIQLQPLAPPREPRPRAEARAEQPVRMPRRRPALLTLVGRLSTARR